VLHVRYSRAPRAQSISHAARRRRRDFPLKDCPDTERFGFRFRASPEACQFAAIRRLFRDEGRNREDLMNEPHNLVALVTLLALLVFFWMGLRVGGARQKFQVAAPATTGNPEFERHFRVQMNTLEGLALFLPSLWLFGFYWVDWIAAAIGAVWILGRLLYMFSYVKEPTSRSAGFGLQMLASVVLLVGALAGVVRSIMALGLV
jgi:glutathione S-transferase